MRKPAEPGSASRCGAGSPGGCRMSGSPSRRRSSSTARRSRSSGRCPRPKAPAEARPPRPSARAAAEGRIKRFREETREQRIEIAREAEHRFRRKVAWGARCGDLDEMFTTLSVPVMTRLRQSERRVLDTLVDAGVARSRSDALAWCVRLTGEHADAWLAELRDALRRVEEVRAQGPRLRRVTAADNTAPEVKGHVTIPVGYRGRGLWTLARALARKVGHGISRPGIPAVRAQARVIPVR